jgi:hypothetical protein
VPERCTLKLRGQKWEETVTLMEKVWGAAGLVLGAVILGNIIYLTATTPMQPKPFAWWPPGYHR